MGIKIVLADDHKILRDGLRNIIEKNANMSVIGEAENGRQAMELCTKLKPDVVVMDVAMSGLNGIEATRQIVVENADCKVIALSMYSDKRFVSGMLKAGAFGYILKDSASGELIKAIKTVLANQKYVCQQISGIILNELVDSSQENAESGLSMREKEVLQLIAEGKSSKEIGEILFLSSKTVDTHRKNIMDKLELRTLPELTKYAIRSGLTTLDN
ncbi:response regulator transcription factor [Draconibacterium halophilum]|uniref:Response regulator transcription factor n=2 Tax=Draconibacterium halophilum TaxID=2706887 RepID=A0A6C0RIW4_9BACT|nr:response regulator transcription factor [Draconibacterium halophilum]